MPAHILGDYKSQKESYKPLDYFIGRDCWVDCRTPNMLNIHKDANIGWCVVLIVQSHNTTPGKFGDIVSRPIFIDKNAFIASFSILYNCKIGEGAIVACGSVVRSIDVPP